MSVRWSAMAIAVGCFTVLALACFVEIGDVHIGSDGSLTDDASDAERFGNTSFSRDCMAPNNVVLAQTGSPISAMAVDQNSVFFGVKVGGQADGGLGTGRIGSFSKQAAFGADGGLSLKKAQDGAPVNNDFPNSIIPDKLGGAFFSAPSTHYIGHLSNDGVTATPVYSGLPSSPLYLSADPRDATKLLWLDAAGSIWSGSADGKTPASVVMAAPKLDGGSTDFAHGFVADAFNFFFAYSTGTSCTGGVMRADRDAGTECTLAANAAPAQIGVGNGNVYWTNSNPNCGASSVQYVPNQCASLRSLLPGASNQAGGTLVVDAPFIYYTDQTTGSQSVYWACSNGTPNGTRSPVDAGASNPVDLAFDDSAIYSAWYNTIYASTRPCPSACKDGG